MSYLEGMINSFNRSFDIYQGWGLNLKCVVNDGNIVVYRAEIINPDSKVVRAAEAMGTNDSDDPVTEAQIEAIENVLFITGCLSESMDEQEENNNQEEQEQEENPFEPADQLFAEEYPQEKETRQKKTTKKSGGPKKKKTNKKQEINPNNKKALVGMLEMLNENFDEDEQYTLEDIAEEVLEKDDVETQEDFEKIVDYISKKIEEFGEGE